MGFIRTVALAILAISGLTFIALFGQLPAFRKTPIGFLHRLVWKHIPRGIAYCDNLLLRGRLMNWCGQTGSYLWNDNHPVILIFFSALLVGGELAFLPPAWPRMSTVHRVCAPLAVVLPYVFLYACVVSTSYITPQNHAKEMARYPYDGVIFHPGHRCSTCQFVKPARSKHCRYCKACVSRQDHHCVWLMNCVGSNNYHYFFCLLLSLSVLLGYASCLGYALLSRTLVSLFPPGSGVDPSTQGWVMFINVWTIVIAWDIRIGSVTLLALMTFPLAMAFLVYHTYLVWAGVTTNETSKWAEVREDVLDGYVFKSTTREIYGNHHSSSSLARSSRPWPVSSDQLLGWTDGSPPAKGSSLVPGSNDIRQPENQDAVDPRWVRLRSMKDVDNIYDLGFWNNLLEVFNLPLTRP